MERHSALTPALMALSCPPLVLPAGAATWLLRRGANVAAMKRDGWRDTALHYAAGCGSLETVQALLAWGADAAATNALGALRCRGGADASCCSQ